MPSFVFNDTATTEIYTLSLHDALPIYHHVQLLGPLTRGLAVALAHHAGPLGHLEHLGFSPAADAAGERQVEHDARTTSASVTSSSVRDWKSTRLNSRHAHISYAVFCF